MQIKEAIFTKSSSTWKECPAERMPEYAFIGRSNVGKSSFINMLTNNSKLAKTSSKPGKTQLINHFLINKQWYLVDLPGYGYANRSKKGVADIQRVIGSYLENRMEMTCLFVLIDSRLEPQKIDVNFMNWLGENQVPFVIIFTKADKQSKSRTESKIRGYLEKLKEEWEELPPYFITSSLSGAGRDDVLSYIESINTSLNKK